MVVRLLLSLVMLLGWHYIWGLGIGQWIEKQLVIIVIMMIIDSDQRLKDPYSDRSDLKIVSQLASASGCFDSSILPDSSCKAKI